MGAESCTLTSLVKKRELEIFQLCSLDMGTVGLGKRPVGLLCRSSSRAQQNSPRFRPARYKKLASSAMET